jgi:sulfoxide reductase heme-binding subunit YedZ
MTMLEVGMSGAGTAARRWKKPLLKVAVFTAGLLPLAAMLFGAFSNQLGANPIETLERETGEWALRFLLITLAMTPLRKWLKTAWPLRIRRMLGLFSAFYALLHLLVWLWLDQQFAWSAIVEDLTERPYIIVGAMAGVLMLVLAVTSLKVAVRKLGTRWQLLHRGIYPMTVLVLLHYLWLIKADYGELAVYVLLASGLFATRLPVLHASR